MRRPISTKAVVNYAALGFLVLLGYKLFLGANQRGSKDVLEDRKISHPKNVHGNTEHHKDGAMLPGAEHSEEKNVEQKPMDVGDIPKNVEEKVEETKMTSEEKEIIHDRMVRKESALKKPKDVFFPDGVDWELEEEMKKRRTLFFKSIQNREMPLEENEFRNMHEEHDNFAFVTAASHSTYPAAIQFIYSVQYFYPDSPIAIYDIGLKSDERQFIESLCKTEVLSMWLQVWPEYLYNIRHIVWRPLLLQFATAKFGHFVYVEPGRFIYKQFIKEYINHSRMHGFTVGGKQMKYSTYAVTDPHMYTFLSIDERKLLKVPHFDFTLLIIHNTNRVINYFLRYLTACTLEEYCIAPPGAQSFCNAITNSKRYAQCHRFDESAINLIVNKWHDYKPKEYLLKDHITKYFDGQDMTKKVKVCNRTTKEEI